MVFEGSSASSQRLRQRCATVDHSDIRGSSASTRHHGRDPSGAALRLGARVRPEGHRIVLAEGSPLPRATTAAVCLRFSPSVSCDSLTFSGNPTQRGILFPLDVYADCPDEAEQLAPDRGDHLLFALAARHQACIALMQPVLCLPGQRGDGRTAAPLPDGECLANRGAVPVSPSRLHRARASSPAASRSPYQSSAPGARYVRRRVRLRAGNPAASSPAQHGQSAAF